MEDKTAVKSEPKECRCSELESKLLELESEIEKKKTQYEELEAKNRKLEAEKNVIEEEPELKTLKREKEGNEMSSGREKEEIVDLTEEGEGEEDAVVQLMIENRVLECEKRRAEGEVEFLKQKLKELESRVPNEAVVFQTGAGTPSYVTPSKHISSTEGEKGEVPAKRWLHQRQGDGNTCISTDHPLEGIMGSEKEIVSKESSKRVLFQPSYEEKMDNCNHSVPFICTPKRKRASNIVTSDTESEDDDIPICKLKRSAQASSDVKSCSVTAAPSSDDNIGDLVTPPRRRLVLLRNCKSGTEKSSSSGLPTAEDVEDKSEDTGSESEGESLNGFIVDSDEESDLNDSSSEADDSDDNVDFGEILSKLNRSKDQKLEWEFEADMLAAFGKDPELCMKAVCALYRQQTSEEKVSRGTLVYNYRGFSKFDARRGTTLAEYLTDGDPQGGLKRSVEELHKYDPKAVEMCRTFATRYSKQLFEIYKNKEDPLFP
ncbi:Reticulocyte-binding protein 2 a [Melia azedarach]|uniref:Reticulocyte-binding protein 2 a n=1 Tax=Melia azedarach TaxID=155640 RepID=A0ACC1X3J8_MELAZ|nr:Reticulocyte-binding protein 2 a [Melia azedarach]